MAGLFKANIQMPDVQRRRLEDFLNPSQLMQAQNAIVHKVTKGVNVDVRRTIAERTNIAARSKYLTRAVKSRFSSAKPIEGFVDIYKGGIPLIAFGVKASRTSGVTATILKGGPPWSLAHAFIATMRSGHDGVFVRRRMGAGAAAGPAARAGVKRMVTPSGFAERTPILEVFGPPIFKLVSEPEIKKTIEESAKVRMQKETESQLSRFLKQQPIEEN